MKSMIWSRSPSSSQVSNAYSFAKKILRLLLDVDWENGSLGARSGQYVEMKLYSNQLIKNRSSLITRERMYI